MQDLYTDYLISQNAKACATHLSSLLNGAVSHDMVTRFLNKKDFSSKDLWQYSKKYILKDCKNNPGVLIFDDTFSEKEHSSQNEIINWNYDHSKGRFIKGSNILTCFYRSENLKLPVSYEIIKKDKFYTDKITCKIKRRSSVSKNEHFRNHLKVNIKNKINFQYVLADSWYGSRDNIIYISEELKKKFVLGLKSNRLIRIYDEGSQKWTCYSQIKHSNIKADRPYLVKLKGCNILLTLLKKVFKNGDGSVGTLYLISNDLELNSESLYNLYKKRWDIEVYHKEIKNNTSLSKSPTKIVKSQSNHIYMSILAYSRFEILKNNSFYKNQHQIKELLLLEANKASMKELSRLQKLFKDAA